jgi:hypothetical protein
MTRLAIAAALLLASMTAIAADPMTPGSGGPMAPASGGGGGGGGSCSNSLSFVACNSQYVPAVFR